jgi:hypothetical protein
LVFATAKPSLKLRHTRYAVVPSVDIPYGKKGRLNGLFMHLGRECGGTVHEKGVVEVTSSSVCTGQATYQLKNIFDAQNATEFLSNLVADQ